MKNDSHKCKLTVFSFHLIFFLSDRSHCLLMFDAVNKTSNDMELSLCVGNCNESNSGKCWIFHLLGFCCCNSLLILIFFVFWLFFAVEGELTTDGAMNIQGNDKNRWDFFFFFHVAGVAFSKSITVFMVISFPYSRITMNLPRFTLPVSDNHNEEVSIFHSLESFLRFFSYLIPKSIIGIVRRNN